MNKVSYEKLLEITAASARFCGLMDATDDVTYILYEGKQIAKKELLDCSRYYDGRHAWISLINLERRLIVNDCHDDSTIEKLFNLILEHGGRSDINMECEGGPLLALALEPDSPDRMTVRCLVYQNALNATKAYKSSASLLVRQTLTTETLFIPSTLLAIIFEYLQFSAINQ